MTLLLSSVATDLTRRIIPNAITLSTCIAGLIYHVSNQPAAAGFFFSSAGLLTGGFLLLLPYRQGWTGGGDVKLLSALGAWIGPFQIIHVFLYSSIVGGIMAAIHLFRARRKDRNHQTPGNGNSRQSEKKNDFTLPYALAVTAGYILFWVRGELF